jgi:hypothetical protein
MACSPACALRTVTTSSCQKLSPPRLLKRQMDPSKIMSKLARNKNLSNDCLFDNWIAIYSSVCLLYADPMEGGCCSKKVCSGGQLDDSMHSMCMCQIGRCSRTWRVRMFQLCRQGRYWIAGHPSRHDRICGSRGARPYYICLLGRYWMASANCAVSMASEPARSAIVRASFRMR